MCWLLASLVQTPDAPSHRAHSGCASVVQACHKVHSKGNTSTAIYNSNQESGGQLERSTMVELVAARATECQQHGSTTSNSNSERCGLNSLMLPRSSLRERELGATKLRPSPQANTSLAADLGNLIWVKLNVGTCVLSCRLI